MSRRKIRKGTQSCWQCKRRKVRCHYAASKDSVCDGCKRRKTTCTTQEFPDDSVKGDGNGQLFDRLDQLQGMVEHLVRRVDALDVPDYKQNSLASHAGYLKRNNIGAPCDVQSSCIARPVADSSCHHDLLRRVLLEAWPSRSDLDAILVVPGEISGLIHGATFAPLSTISDQKIPSVHQIVQPPATDSHPVLIARKFLILATYLQSLSPLCTQYLSTLNVDSRATMRSALETAHNCVTGNDELLESVEGVECLMIEGMYQNNAGNLRKAWHCIKRAVLIAQMMNLRRDTVTRPLRFLDTDTMTRVDPEYMWFRLVQMNRYLSLAIGLPQGAPDNHFGTYQVLENCSPTDRMQRMDCVAAGYILQRNEAGLCDTATTHMIDKLLQESAASQPPSWWLVPDMHSNEGGQVELSKKVVHVMDQLTHYHLVTQLHLPHLVRPHTDHEHDYSKTTAVNASREVLARFTRLQSVHSFTSFCRGISLLAFIACTTLCIVHIDAKRRCRSHIRSQSSSAYLDALADQYEGDRDMMVLTLGSMNRMAHMDDDPIASKIAPVLGQLLSQEEDAAPYENYVTSLVSTEDELGFGSGGKISSCGQILQIHVPYVGTINFERGGTS